MQTNYSCHLSVVFSGQIMSNQQAQNPSIDLALHLLVAGIGIAFGPLRRSTSATETAHQLAPVHHNLHSTPSDCVCHCHHNLTATCDVAAPRSIELLIPVCLTCFLSFVVLVKVGCCITRGQPVAVGKSKGSKGVWGAPLQ